MRAISASKNINYLYFDIAFPLGNGISEFNGSIRPTLIWEWDLRNAIQNIGPIRSDNEGENLKIYDKYNSDHILGVVQKFKLGIVGHSWGGRIKSLYIGERLVRDRNISFPRIRIGFDGGRKNNIIGPDPGFRAENEGLDQKRRYSLIQPSYPLMVRI